MKFRSILLYTLGISLFLLGNRELWDKLQEQRKDDEKRQKAFADAELNLKQGFETQAVRFDTVQQKWVNPNFYFQVSKGGLVAKSSKPSDNAQEVKTTVRVETNDDENASDSN